MSVPPAHHPGGSEQPRRALPEPPALPAGVLCARLGPGANCSSAGSAIDILFYGSVLVGALAVALAAALPPRPPRNEGEGDDGAEGPSRAARGREPEGGGEQRETIGASGGTDGGDDEGATRVE